MWRSLIAIVAVVSVAFVVWGSLSAWSWIVAALAFQALGGLRNAAYGRCGRRAYRALLTALVASVLIALIARKAARKPSRARTRRDATRRLRCILY